MRLSTRFLITGLVIASLGVVSTPVGANGSLVATGSVTPQSVAAGGTLTVTFDAPRGADQCGDNGPDNGQYSGRPLVFGLFPTSVALEPGLNLPTAWYENGTPLSDLGFVTSAGTLATSSADDNLSGWQGSFTGQVAVPSTLQAGAYNAVWSCGSPDELSYDAGGAAVTQPVTVTGGSDPGPQPSPDGISLTLDFRVGDNIRTGAAGVPVGGAGVKPGADYTVVLRSDPVQIGAGVTDVNGAFSAVYPVPANTPAGPHSVTVTSVNTADQVVTAAAWFTVDANGIVTAISFEGPTPAAASPRFTG